MFELATPWILILIPLPWLIHYVLKPRKVDPLNGALKIPFFDMLAQFIHRVPSRKINFRIPVWLTLSWLFLIFAMSGPRWVGEPLPLTRDGRNIILALDISGSMALDDMILNGYPSSRLDVVKQAAEDFVRQRTQDKIGLILFGSRAYLQTPLTYDKQHILLRIDDASVGLAGQATAIGDPIGLAVKHLKNTPAQGRIIILLTDGVNNAGTLSPLKAATLAKEEGIKIYTIGLGVEPTGSRFLPMMRVGDLDEKTLQQIAQLTHGKYFRAGDHDSLQQIYTLINQIETITQDEGQIRPQSEYYPWPLSAALLFLISGLLSAHKSSLVPVVRRHR